MDPSDTIFSSADNKNYRRIAFYVGVGEGGRGAGESADKKMKCPIQPATYVVSTLTWTFQNSPNELSVVKQKKGYLQEPGLLLFIILQKWGGGEAPSPSPPRFGRLWKRNFMIINLIQEDYSVDSQ